MTPLGVPGRKSGTQVSKHHGNKRHRFYPVAFPREPGEPIGLVKVLTHGATTPVVCQKATGLWRAEGQVCSRCGRPVPKTLSDRWHTCPYEDCGLSLQRDHNAARNILNRAGLARAGV